MRLYYLSFASDRFLGVVITLAGLQTAAPSCCRVQSSSGSPNG